MCVCLQVCVCMSVCVCVCVCMCVFPHNLYPIQSLHYTRMLKVFVLIGQLHQDIGWVSLTGWVSPMRGKPIVIGR